MNKKTKVINAIINEPSRGKPGGIKVKTLRFGSQ